MWCLQWALYVTPCLGIIAVDSHIRQLIPEAEQNCKGINYTQTKNLPEITQYKSTPHSTVINAPSMTRNWNLILKTTKYNNTGKPCDIYWSHGNRKNCGHPTKKTHPLEKVVLYCCTVIIGLYTHIHMQALQ